MGRFLTPGHVGLLALIEIYLFGQTSSDARLIILELITQQIVIPLEHECGSIDQIGSHSALHLPSLASLLQHCPTDVPGRSLYDTLIDRLWELDGIDGLSILFNEANNTIELSGHETIMRSRRIARTSPLGLFIRRCCVEFTRLPFNESLKLWHDFVRYRSESYGEWQRNNPEESLRRAQNADEYGFGADLATTQQVSHCKLDSQSDTSTPGAMQIEELLTALALQLQKLGTRIPDSIKDRIGSWLSSHLESGPHLLRFFIAFFDHWKAGQYLMALESIHRYFDYSLAARTAADDMRAHYQYALLHLSILHADFGCWIESVDAMNECIATARENNDKACLNFALSWLLYLRNANPHASRIGQDVLSGSAVNGERDEMAFLKTKAREGKQWSLMSSTLLEQAKAELHQGGSMMRAQEYLLQSNYLNNQQDLRTLFPVASILYAASFERLGHPHIASRTLEAIVAVHIHHCSVADRARSICRLAYLEATCGDFDRALHRLDKVLPELQKLPKYHNLLAAYLVLIRSRRYLDSESAAVLYLLPHLQAIQDLGDLEYAMEAKVNKTRLVTVS